MKLDYNLGCYVSMDILLCLYLDFFQTKITYYVAHFVKLEFTNAKNSSLT